MCEEVDIYVPVINIEQIMEDYAVPELFQGLLNFLISCYLRLTLINIAIFFLKYVPTSIYLIKLVKDSYKKTREKMNRNRAAIEDIQLQIDIMNTKMGVRNNEMVERTTQLKRAAQRLREVRTKVRELLANDEELKRLRDLASSANNEVPGETAASQNGGVFEEKDFINNLLKEFKCGGLKAKEMQKMDCGDPTQKFSSSPETSVYCSLSGVDDANRECNVKIVKVTNVYKVAYLKNYVKQRRLRRASKQAMLEKKVSSIKKLLEDWQKTLDSVINLKEQSIDHDSHEETKDTRTNESDSDMNKTSELYPEEVESTWDNQTSYELEYDSPRAKNCYETEAYINIINEANESQNKLERSRHENMQNPLFILPEETNSQMEIEEIKSEYGEGDHQDVVVI